MKKKISIKELTLSFLFTLLLINTALAKDTSIVLQRVSGDVKKKISDSADWAKASEGEVIKVGAVIRTGSDSSCILKWSDSNIVKLTAFATMKIDKAEADSAGKDNVAMNLSVGNALGHVKKGGVFTVKTPTAIAGVRGTDLFANVSEDKSSTFGVTEGSIAVSTESGGEITVTQDMLVMVDTSGMMAEPAPMPEEMKAQVTQSISEMKQEANVTSQGESSSSEKKSKESEKKDNNATDAIDSINKATDIQTTVDTINNAAASYETGTVGVTIQVEP